MSVPYTKTDNAVTVVLGFVPHVVPITHPNFGKIIEALLSGANDNEIRSLVDLPTAIADFMSGAVVIQDRVLSFNGRPLDTTLTRRILQHMEAGEPGLAEPLVKFLENVMENPSYRSAQGLYEWVSKSGLPITGDGQILAWKIVGPDYLSLYSGGDKLDHSIGNIVEQPRNQCDENPDQTCSYGIHFCSTGYLPHYGTAPGNRIVVVKVHPRDVVAFPRDYNTAKGRCCRLEVVGEVSREDVETYFPNANVHRGFDEVANDVEVAAERPAFEIGQRWRTRDGERVYTITELDRGGTYDISGETDQGLFDIFTTEGCFYLGLEGNLDLIELIVDEPEQPVAPNPTDGYAVGQVWKDRTGASWSIKATDRTVPYVIAATRQDDEEAVFTAEGRAWWGNESDNDLVERVS